MSLFNGKWKKTTFDNVDAFIAGIGATGENATTVKQMFEAPDVVMENESDGKTVFSRKTFIGGELKYLVTGEFGKEMETETSVGKIKTKTVLEAENKTVIYGVVGDDGKSVYVVDGDTMTNTWIIRGFSAKRTFTRVRCGPDATMLKYGKL